MTTDFCSHDYHHASCRNNLDYHQPQSGTTQNITMKYKMEICVDVILFVWVDNGQRSGSVLFRYCVM